MDELAMKSNNLKKAGSSNTGDSGPKKPLTLIEQLQEQQKIMREKAEAKRKAQAENPQPEPKKELTFLEQLQE